MLADERSGVTKEVITTALEGMALDKEDEGKVLLGRDRIPIA